MRDTTWMDAEAALAYGFVDRVASPTPASTVINCAVARDVAEKQPWARDGQTIGQAGAARQEGGERPSAAPCRPRAASRIRPVLPKRRVPYLSSLQILQS